MIKAGFTSIFRFVKVVVTIVILTQVQAWKSTSGLPGCLLKEIHLSAACLPEPFEVSSIYVGGGTPSYFPSHYLNETHKRLPSISDIPEGGRSPWKPTRRCHRTSLPKIGAV
jgi:hypothetical protein